MHNLPLTFLWEVLGGFALFLLGMKSMTDGLQKLAGERVRQFFERITGNRFTAALSGSCLASLLQSSSAASILTVGFVNAGLISLYQALGVLLGTGVGATLAIQFIAFRVNSVALPAIFLGVVFKYFSRSRKWVNVGALMLGAGLVFFGLQMMETGFLPVKQNTLFQGIHSNIFNWRICAVLLGALLTFLVQSSSAAAGIVIALTSSKLFSFEDGAAMIIGEVLGTSCVALMATINGTMAAKRTAFIYFIINSFAIVCVLIFFPYFLAAVTYLTPGGHGLISAQSFITPDSSGLESLSTDLPLSRSIANAHTLFSILNVFIFLPFIGFFARSATSLLPGKLLDGDSEPQCKYIDIRVINTPSIALLQARNELQRMADIALSMYDDVAAQLYSYDSKRSSLTRRKEEVLDLLQREISAFLVRLSRRPFSNGNAMELPILLHIVNNLEHVGDQNEAILDCLIRKKERKVQFSAAAMDELKKLAHLVGKLLKLSVESLGKATENDLVSARVLKDDIQKQIDFMSAQHIERLTQGTCTVLAGVVYSDIGSSFVKISEYAFNIMKTERELA